MAEITWDTEWHAIPYPRFYVMPAMTLKTVLFHTTTTILTAILITAGMSVIQRYEALQDYHSAAFPAPTVHGRSSEIPTDLLIGRITTATSLANVEDFVAANGWFIAIRFPNHLTAINRRTGDIQEFTGLPSADKPYTPYDFIWTGRTSDEVFVGSNFRLCVRLLVSANGLTMPTTHNVVTRNRDILSSLPLANGSWASNGLFKDNTTLTINRLSDDRLLPTRDVRQPVFPSIHHPFVSLEANRTSIAVAPDGRRLVQGFWFAPRINIYDESGTLLHAISGPSGITQAFSEQQVHGEVRMKYLPQTTRCYIAITATDQYIFALFSGRTIKDSRAVNGAQIHVFSWDGNLTHIIYLDRPVAAVVVSRDGSLLWGLQREAPPAIIEYDISKSIQSLSTRHF